MAYPCIESGGVIFAYLGPAEPPLLPAYELFTVPEDHRYRPTKSLHECNFLQANEGNIDPGHLSFLHRLEDTGQGRRAHGSDMTPMALNTADVKPTVETENTDYGLRIYTVRGAGPDLSYVRITNFVMPNLCAIGGIAGQDGYQMDWHVPIDDTHHWKYTMAFKRSGPIDPTAKVRGDAITTGYQRGRTRANRYLQDRDEMKSRSFTGLGTNFLDHDAWAVEGPGPIQDRTTERLGVSDKGITRERQLLRQAVRNVQSGQDPLHVVRDPAANHFPELFVRAEVIPASTNWLTYWKQAAASGA